MEMEILRAILPVLLRTFQTSIPEDKLNSREPIEPLRSYRRDYRRVGNLASENCNFSIFLTIHVHRS